MLKSAAQPTGVQETWRRWSVYWMVAPQVGSICTELNSQIQIPIYSSTFPLFKTSVQNLNWILAKRLLIMSS